MKIGLNKLYNAIEKLRNEITNYDREMGNKIELDIQLTEADMKENLIDLITVSASYDTKSREGEIVSHQVVLELFDAFDGKKPNIVHTTKREVT